jgi:hypothetical protein
MQEADPHPRGMVERNPPQQNASRTAGRNDEANATERVRQEAANNKKLPFMALLPQFYNLETLGTPKPTSP